MKPMLLAAAATAALTLAACSEPADTADDTAADTLPADPAPTAEAALTPTVATEYIAAAGAGDMYEIESSRLALEKTEDEAVRTFAQMMVDDHTGTTEQITSAAEAAGITPGAPALTPMQQGMIDELTALSGADFDRAYIRQQLEAHRAALGLHRNYSQSGDTEELREVATAAVPIVEGHITQLEGVNADGE